MSTTPHNGQKNDGLAKRCMEMCFGDPEGPGARIKSLVDQWSGAIALAGKAIGAGFALLALAVTVAIALAPSLVRGAVSDVVPGLVDSAVSAALRRHGIAEQSPPSQPHEAIVQAPRSPWIVPQAHAAQDK